MGWRARWHPSAQGTAPAAVAATVFISHSIVDSDAARRVAGVLERTGHPVWRFQDQLRGGSPWYDEMLDAVVRNDVVLFLASRASVASSSCRAELVCAQQHGKRIVVVRLDPDLLGTDLTENIRFIWRIQWIEWTDEPALTAEIDAAVSTDFARIRSLTRLDVRATDWHAAGQPNRTVLRGAELVAAEKLLLVAEEHKSAAMPSRIAWEFVERSQRQRRRQRVLGVFVGFVVVLALVASSLYAVNRSQQEETARRGGLVQQLRSEAARVARTDPARSSRLQVAAYSLDRTPSGRALLARDLLASNLRRYLPERGTKGGPGTLTYAADGSALFSAGGDGTLRVYSSDGYEPVAAVSLGATLYSVAAVAETGTIVVSVDKRIVIQRPSPSGPPVTVSDTTVADVDVGPVVVSPDGRLLAAGSRGHAAGLFTVSESGAVRAAAQLPSTGGLMVGATFSHSGRLLAVTDGFAVTVWDVTTPASPVRRKVIEFTSPAAYPMSFSPDDRLLAIGADEVGVYELDAPASGPVYMVPLQSQDVDIAFAPGPGAVLAVTGQDTTISLWDVDARASAPIKEFRQQGVIPAVLTFSPDGRYLAVGGVDGSVTEWLVRPRGEPEVLASGTGPGEISALALTSENRLVAISSATSGLAQLYRVEAGTSQLVGTTPDLGRAWLSAVTFHDGGRVLAVGDYEGFLGLVDVATLDPATARVGTQPGAYSSVDRINFSADGSLLATGGSSGPGFLWRVAPDSLTLVGQLDADFGAAPFVSFRPDGKRLAVGGVDGKTVLYDVSDSAITKVGTLPSDDDRRTSLLSWLPDGEHIAVGTELGIRLFSVSDPAAPVLIGSARETSAVGLALVLLPDLPLMAVWGNGQVSLWNVTDPSSPVLVAGWAAGTAEDVVAAFSSDGRWLALSDFTEWTVFDLTESVEPVADPGPTACLAAANVELSKDLAEAVAEFDPDDPCRG